MTAEDGLTYILSVVYFKIGRLSITWNVRKSPIPGKKKCDCRSFRVECLEAHNKYRKAHGVPELTLTDELCDYAQEWADALSIGDALLYRKRPRFGETVMSIFSNDPHFLLKGDFPVDIWYEEKNEYTFGKEPENAKSEHFCQIVWKNTTNLGVGIAKSDAGSYYIVANYCPPGNRPNQYIENVLNPSGDVLPSVEADQSQDADASGDISDAKQKIQEIKDAILKIDEVKDDADALTNIGKETKDKLLEVVNKFAQIKEKTQHTKVVDPQIAKEKIQNVVNVWKNIAGITADKEITTLTDVLDEGNTTLDDITNAVAELEEEEKHAHHLIEVVDDAKDKTQNIADTIDELTTNPDLIETLKEKASEVFHTVENMAEDETHALHIPSVIGAIIDKVKSLMEAITKLFSDENVVDDLKTAVDEAAQKNQEVQSFFDSTRDID